jgi:hypothetical protein
MTNYDKSCASFIAPFAMSGYIHCQLAHPTKAVPRSSRKLSRRFEHLQFLTVAVAARAVLFCHSGL